MNRIIGIHILIALFLLYHQTHIYLVQYMFIFIIWCTNNASYCYLYTTL